MPIIRQCTPPPPPPKSFLRVYKINTYGFCRFSRFNTEIGRNIPWRSGYYLKDVFFINRKRPILRVSYRVLLLLIKRVGMYICMYVKFHYNKVPHPTQIYRHPRLLPKICLKTDRLHLNINLSRLTAIRQRFLRCSYTKL